MFLEISQNSQENTCVRASFLIKLQALGLQLYYKRDSDTGVFLWILRNFWEHLFYRTSPEDCFWNCKYDYILLSHIFFSCYDEVTHACLDFFSLLWTIDLWSMKKWKNNCIKKIFLEKRKETLGVSVTLHFFFVRAHVTRTQSRNAKKLRTISERFLD